MLRVAAALLIAALASAPAAAQSFDDPRELLEAFYAGYMAPNEFPPAEEPFRSERLNQLFEQDMIDAGEGIGRVDFDVFVNGQDYLVTDLDIGEPYMAGGKAVVSVTLRNMDELQQLGFLLVNEGGWKIDNVWNTTSEFSYDLLDMLQAPLP
jgi:hypothetical protein